MADLVQFVDSIPPDVLGDSFDGRTEATGWGVMSGASASMRPRWGPDGSATPFSVASGTGRISVAAVNTAYQILVATRVVKFDQTATFTIPVVATGGPIYLGLLAPYASNADKYKAELLFLTGGTIDIRIRKTINSVSTDLATGSSGLSYTAGARFKLRFQQTGNTWRAKVWAVASAEPAAWTITTTHASELAFGRPGVTAVADAANTNTLPLLVEVDDYTCTPAPGIRLDLNNESPWAVPYDGFDWSPPRLRRAVSQTLLRDGSVYPASAYDDRLLRMRLELHTATQDDSATQIQALAREVNRPTNIVRWQPEGMTQAVYLRTIRSDAGRPTEVPGGGSLRLFDVELLAEPFAYGAQQILAPVVVNNDPSSATNPQQFDVAAAHILGDVDTPVVVRFDAADVAGKQSLVAVRSRSISGALFYELEMADGTNQADTTEPGNDPVYAGPGNNYKRTSFATNTTMVNRVTFSQFPPAPFLTTGYRGQYRVFLRYRKSVGGDTIRVRLLWAGTSTSDAIVGQTVTLVGTTDRRYADLGVVSLPPGADPMHDGYSGLLWPASGVPLALQAERPSGSGNADWDDLVFVACDERLCYISWPSSLTGYAVLDGIREMAYEQSADTAGGGPAAIGDALGIPVGGLFPTLTPAVDNRVYVMPNVGTTGAQDAIGDTVDADLTYWPRYLYARPAAT